MTDLDGTGESDSEEPASPILRRKTVPRVLTTSQVEFNLKEICKRGSPFDDHYVRVKEVGSG